jgi:hypothetical protein
MPSTTPGIATYEGKRGREGLGEWYEVTTPDGRTMYLQKTDVGPGAGPRRKGVGLDINAPASDILYPGGPSTFPSGKSGFTYRRIGPKLPEEVTPHTVYAPGTAPSQTARQPSAPPTAEGQQRYNYFQSQGQQPPPRGSLTTVETPFGKVTAHPDAAEDTRNFFRELGEQGAPIRRLGSYNPRPKRWGGGWSSHAYATAFDLDDEQFLSPAMKKWIAENPQRWADLKEKYNFGQPLPKKDPGHVEWRGPKPDGGRREAAPRGGGGVSYLEGSRMFGALDRGAMDRGQNVSVNGTGKLTVDVRAPAGTRVAAEGGGIFKKTEVVRQIQNEPAVSGGAAVYDPRTGPG